MEAKIKRAEVLIEALPYIRRFSGKPFVVKYGGSAMLNDELREKVARDLVLLKLVGINLVVVHGGGKHINEMLGKLDIKGEFRNGLRVTDEETMRIVEMVLSGRSNKEVVTLINKHGGNAVGLSGKDGPLLHAVPYVDAEGGTYGQVGVVESVSTSLIDRMLDGGFVPVISPVAFGHDGKSYNVNADMVASRVAQAIHASKLIYLTDVPGVLRDREDPASLVSTLTIAESQRLIGEGVISGGMLPKVNSIIECLENGVEKVHIVNGMTPHALLLEVFTDGGIGTEFRAG